MKDFEDFLQDMKDKCTTDDSINKNFRYAVNIIWAKYHSSKKSLN